MITSSFFSVNQALAQVQTGSIRIIAAINDGRLKYFPDVPTMAEQGYAEAAVTPWFGIAVPAGTPQPIVDLLNSEINKVLVRPDVRAAWEKQGAVPMTMKPNEFGVYIQSEIEKWAKLINANAIKPE